MAFDVASLKYDTAGLIPAIAQDHRTGEVLMLAWMNAGAVAQTLATGRVTYWSRSRAAWCSSTKRCATVEARGVTASVLPSSR